MDTTLLDILNKTALNGDDKPTHVTMYAPIKNWTVKDTEWENFWYQYCKEVYQFESIKDHKKFCLAEAPKRYMPLMVNCKIKFHLTNAKQKLYENDFIWHIIYCYQQVMLETLEIDDKEHALTCCILKSNDETEDAEEEDIEKGEKVVYLSLKFPYCKTLASIQTNVIRPRVIKMLRTENVIAKLPQQPITDWEDMIDPHTANMPALMYGSSAKEDQPPLFLESVVGRINADDIDDHVESINIDDAFNHELHEHVHQNLISADMFADKGENVKFWLPMYLSLNYYGPTVLPKSYDEGHAKTSRSKSSSKFDSETTSREDQTPEEMAERFLNMLSRNRAEQEIFWMDVGRALYTVYQGNNRGLDLWIYFTEKSDFKCADDCRDAYLNFFGNFVTLKTLAWYAREDSPQLYREWHKEWYGQAIELATSGLDNDVAEAVYRVYWLEFACARVDKASLYKFENHGWRRLDHGHSLRVLITGDFIKIIEAMRAKVGIDIHESNDNKYKDSSELLLKKLANLIAKLKTRRYKNNVLGESLEKFKVENFTEMLDSNDSLMGCFNGIIEATDEEAVLRPGKPEDYVSKTTGLIYRTDFTWDHPLVKEVRVWMSQVFPDEALCAYASKMFGTCVRGRNTEKIFGVLSGQGDNSKSMLKKALECAFGSYCITFPVTIFTGKSNSGAACPELARAKAVRIGIVQEPDSDATLSNGSIKAMTGNDRFYARMLHENGDEVEAMFKLFLMCNHIPVIPHCDQAIKNRTRIVPFLSTWVKNAPKTPEEQYKQRLFQMDKNFERRIPKLGAAFLYYLVQMYNLYCKEGLAEPKIVSEHTDEYWKDNDIYIGFIRDILEYKYEPKPLGWPEDKKPPIDMSAKIKISDVYIHFKNWFAENYHGIKTPDRGIHRVEILRRLKQKGYDNVIVGMQLKIDLVDI